jgi:RNAse (barnase) inhibitor barstar
MSGLAALLAGHTPPDTYQWHNAAHVEDVQHAVEKAGWKFIYLDGWTIDDKQAFFDATAKALDFPEYFGKNFDALSDCLSDVNPSDCNGVVFLWDGWSPLARHDEQAFTVALSVLRDRVQDDKATKFAAILRGDGPPLDLPELPHKH